MEKWKKIIIHNTLLSTKYEKSTKVFFYKKSSYAGCYTYIANKLIKDYQSGDYYKIISIYDDFEYRVYSKDGSYFNIRSVDMLDEFNRSNMNRIEKEMNSSYIEIIDPEPFFAKTVGILDDVINK